MVTDNSEPESAPDIAVLRSACEESRSVLDHQLSVLDDIDEKAIWSVRTAILVLGLLISAASFADGSAVRQAELPILGLAFAGTIGLASTIWLGIFTYHWSFEEFGIGPNERSAAVLQDGSEHRWRTHLLMTGYTPWIQRQESFNRYNQLLLFITHLLLSMGVTLLLLAGALYVIGA